MPADGSEGMTEIILSDVFIVHDTFENAVEAVGNMYSFDRSGKVKRSCLSANGDFLIFDFLAFTLCVPCD